LRDRAMGDQCSVVGEPEPSDIQPERNARRPQADP